MNGAAATQAPRPSATRVHFGNGWTRRSQPSDLSPAYRRGPRRRAIRRTTVVGAPKFARRRFQNCGSRMTDPGTLRSARRLEHSARDTVGIYPCGDLDDHSRDQRLRARLFHPTSGETSEKDARPAVVLPNMPPSPTYRAGAKEGGFKPGDCERQRALRHGTTCRTRVGYPIRRRECSPLLASPSLDGHRGSVPGAGLQRRPVHQEGLIIPPMNSTRRQAERAL